MKYSQPFKYFISIIIAIFLLCLQSMISYAQNQKTDILPVFDAVDYGIVNDGATMNTQKIQQLIDNVSEAGGGTIYFPPGKYLTGTIFLRNYINLHIESGATILFTNSDMRNASETIELNKNIPENSLKVKGVISR